MDTLRNRQKRWLGHVLRYGSLVRTALEDRLSGKKQKRKPKEMLLSWLLETSDEDGSLARTALEGRLPGKKERERPKEMMLSCPTRDRRWRHGLFTAHGAGTGEAKMLSTKNVNLPVKQNTTAAAVPCLEQFLFTTGEAKQKKRTRQVNKMRQRVTPNLTYLHCVSKKTGPLLRSEITPTNCA